MAERILITANDIKDLQLTLLWLKTRPSIELFEALEDFTAALSFAPLTSHLIPYYDRQIYFSVVKVARIKLRNALNGKMNKRSSRICGSFLVPRNRPMD